MKSLSGRNIDDQQSIFNYRLSRARWVVENVFRILATWFLLVSNLELKIMIFVALAILK